MTHADAARADAALAAARALLRDAGIAARGVRRAGQGGDVLAVDTDADQLARVRELAPTLRRAGFRFVALELGPEDTDRAAARTSGRDRGRGPADGTT